MDRFSNIAEARRRYDPVLVERMGRALYEVDTLGDAIVDELGGAGGMRSVEAWLSGEGRVPKALREMLDEIAIVPDWVDWDRIDRAGVAYWRGGPITGLALSCASLAAGYQSGGGVKPLLFTGQLRGRAYRRMQETGRWYLAATSPDGLRRDQPGFADTLRVRIMHAAVRRRLLMSGEWQQEWGAPINVADVALGIAGEFSTIPVAAMRDAGIHFTDRELEDIQHLWRYVGHLLGVPLDLMSTDEKRAREIVAIRRLTDVGPDENCVELVRALIEDGVPPEMFLPPRLVPLGTRVLPAVLYGFTRHWAGQETADALHLPDSALKHATRVIRPLVRVGEIARRAGLVDGEKVAAHTRGAFVKALDAGNAPTKVPAEREVVPATAS